MQNHILPDHFYPNFVSWNPIQKVPLFTSNMVMAVAKTHPLASLEKIPFKKIEEVPLILPGKGSNSREYVEILFVKHHMKPKISIELNSINALLQMVENSDWATIVAEKALKGWEHSLKSIQITGKVTNVDIANKTVVMDEKVFVLLKDANVVKLNETILVKGRVIGYDSLLEEIKIDQAEIK